MLAPNSQTVIINDTSLTVKELTVKEVHSFFDTLPPEINFIDLLLEPEIPAALLKMSIDDEEAWDSLTLDATSIVENNIKELIEVFKNVNPLAARLWVKSLNIGRAIVETGKKTSI